MCTTTCPLNFFKTATFEDDYCRQMSPCKHFFLLNSVSILRMTPEMVNCLATVTRISQSTDQQQGSLVDLYEQNYRRLHQQFSLKQFELGLTKVLPAMIKPDY